MNNLAEKQNQILAFRTPPHSVEAEQAVIGAVVLNNKVFPDVEWLGESEFYRSAHVILWRRINALATMGIPMDPVVLISALDEAGELEDAGGLDYVADLFLHSRGASNVVHYANIIRDRAISRKLISAGNQIADIGYDSGETQTKIDQAQTLTANLEAKDSAEPKHINDIMRRTVEGIDRRYKHKGEIVGLETGFIDLDRATCGLSPGDMIVVAGRPSMGKTTFAMNIAENAAMRDKFVIMFSLEMSDESLNLRMISSVGGVQHDFLRSGKLQEEHWPAMTSAASRIKDKPLYIDDDGSITSTQLLSRARKIASRAGRQPDLIIVDYIQLLNDPGEGTERVTKISRNIKLAATSLKCPVIAISQLNRSVEQRSKTDRRPLMSDLRDSGALEQDADIIVMMYRDEVYNEDSHDKGIGEAIIRKQRNGPLKTVYLQSQLDLCRFRTLDRQYTAQDVPAKSRRYDGYDD